MIYTSADRVEHIASALSTLSPEWAATLKGVATYIRNLETRNFRLATENRELQEAIDADAASINEAELDAFAARINAGNIARDVVTANVLSSLDDAELASMSFPTYRTLDDLIESLKP